MCSLMFLHFPQRFERGSCEDFSSVWSDLLVNSVKIEDDGDATDFENVDDFEILFNFNDNNPKLSANEPSSVNAKEFRRTLYQKYKTKQEL